MIAEDELLMADPPCDITELLVAWGRGDSSAFERLVPLVDRELRRMARSYLSKEQSDADLQTTAILNEVFLRLIHAERVSFKHRCHFFAVCAQLMRRILVDHARARRTVKRGAGARHVSLDESRLVPEKRFTDIIAIDEVLPSLARRDPRKAKVVELRFFGGLSVEETAQALDISNDSVVRDWKLARLWLWRELGGRAEKGVVSRD